MGEPVKELIPVVEGSEGLERADQFSLSSAVPVLEPEPTQTELEQPVSATLGGFLSNMFGPETLPKDIQSYNISFEQHLEANPAERKIVKSLLLPSWEAVQSVKSGLVSLINKEPLPDNPFELKDRSITEIPLVKQLLTSEEYVGHFKNSLKIGANLSFFTPTSPLFFMPSRSRTALLNNIDKMTPETIMGLSETGGDLLALGAVEGAMGLLERYATTGTVSKLKKTSVPDLNIEGKGYLPEEIKSINKVNSAVEDLVKKGSDDPFKELLKQRKTYNISPQEINLWKGAHYKEPGIQYGAGLPIPQEPIKTPTGKDVIGAIPTAKGGEITVYHGTYADFDKFAHPKDVPEEFMNVDPNAHTFGTYFTDNKKLAAQFGNKVKSAFINKEKLFDLTDIKSFDDLVNKLPIDKEREAWELKNMVSNSYYDRYEATDSFYKPLEQLMHKYNLVPKLQEQGYEGIIFNDKENGVAGKTFVIFNPEHIQYSKLSPKEGGTTDFYAGLPTKGGKERGFTESVKNAMPLLNVAGQYIPRSTDELAIKAKTLIKEDLKTAQDMASKGTDDASVAVGSELLKYYVTEAEKASGLSKDVIYEKATDLANSMAERLTELGRSVQAASILSRLTPEGQVRFAAKTIQKYNADLKDLNKRIPELTPVQTKDILTQMKEIQGMPEGEEKAIKFRDLQNYIADLVPTPLMDKIVTVWKAGLLTGLKTTGVNILANISHGVSEIAKDIPATLIDMVTSTITGKRSVAFTTQGITEGGKEGAIKGWRFLKTGYDERNVLAKLDYKRVNVGKSKLAKGIQKYEEFVFQLLGAEDQPFYYGAKMHSLYEQAKVEAINKGLKGEEAEKFIDNLVMNPNDDMVLLAVNDAKIAVFQNETALGRLAKGIQDLPGGVGQFILPFGKTPSAVATQIINYTPAGAVKTLLTSMGKDGFDQRDFSKGMGRAVTGTGVLGVGYWLFKQGMINLDRPKSEAEQKRWELEGRKPNTIKIGNSYRQIQVLGPLGNVLLVGAHFAKAFEDSGSVAGALSQGAFGAIKSFTEQTFLQSVNSFMDAISDPQRSAGSFINSFVGSVVPTIVKDVAVGTDKIARRVEGPLQSIIERMPILRYMLQPKIDVFGKDVERSTNFIETMADPTRPSKVKNDPIVVEIRRLTDAKQTINTSQLGKKTGYKSLTPEQNTTLWRQSGQIAYEQLSQLMQYDAYNAMPDERKTQRINKIIGDAKDTARLSAVMEATSKMSGEKLTSTLKSMKKEGLLTEELFKKYMRLR